MRCTRRKRIAYVLLFCLLFIAAARFTDCSLPLFWRRKQHLGDIVSAMLPPELSFAPRVIAPLLSTLQMSVTGTVLGSWLALMLAPLCAENLPAPGLLRGILRLIVQILRSFPSLILALLATFLLGLGTFAGTAALTVYTFSIMMRLTYEDIEGVELCAYQALRSMGAGFGQAYCLSLIHI